MLKPPLCKPCPLHIQGTSFSSPEGTGVNGVSIIQESLTTRDASTGRPMDPTGQFGAKLEQVFRMLGVRRDDFRLWGLIACQPPLQKLVNSWYEQTAVNCCSNHFVRAIGGAGQAVGSAHKNRVVLGLGDGPLKHLAGIVPEGKRSLSYSRGYVYKSNYGWYVPSYGARYIGRGMNEHLTPILVSDVDKALRIANGQWDTFEGGAGYKRPKYNEGASLDEAWAYYYRLKDQSQRTISYDLESPSLAEMKEEEKHELIVAGEVEVTQIQFSHRKRYGMALPYNATYLPVINAIFALPNDKANHNVWQFDNQVLRAKGHKIAGRIHDTMWMFKHYQPNLEKDLQAVASFVDFPFPWKHLFGEKIGWYGCADVDAVQWILADLPPLMKSRGVWDGYYRHVFEINIELEKASERGTPVNPERHEELREKLVKKLAKLDSDVQKVIPNEIKNISPKVKDKATGLVRFGYIREPKEIKVSIAAYKRARSQAISKGLVPVPAWKFIYRKTGLVLRSFEGDVKRWCKLLPFKPNSSQQVIKYIKWQNARLTKSKVKDERDLGRLYQVPRTIREGKETTGKEAIKELAEETGDEVLLGVSEYRGVKKMITNDLPNWKPRPSQLVQPCPQCIDKPDEYECGWCEGSKVQTCATFKAVHTTWGYTAPTGQLNTKRPNIQNASAHTAIGQEFRWIIEAPAGYVMVEFDFRSFHVAVMGWRANDANYIRFSQLDPHSIFTSYIDGIPKELSYIQFDWTDERILAVCKEIKKNFGDLRQKVAKPCVLGNQLGLGPNKLWRQNKKYIHGINHARELQARLANVFPKTAQVKEEIKESVYRLGYSINPFSRIQYFYDIRKTPTPKGWRWDGRDCEKALAFEVQSPAFGKVMEDILECRDRGYNDRYNFINTIHDSVIFMPAIGDLDNCISDVCGVLIRPCGKLVNQATGEEGLKVGVEVKKGRNMQKWDEVRNREGMQEVRV